MLASVSVPRAVCRRDLLTVGGTGPWHEHNHQGGVFEFNHTQNRLRCRLNVPPSLVKSNNLTLCFSINTKLLSSALAAGNAGHSFPRLASVLKSAGIRAIYSAESVGHSILNLFLFLTLHWPNYGPNQSRFYHQEMPCTESEWIKERMSWSFFLTWTFSRRVWHQNVEFGVRTGVKILFVILLCINNNLVPLCFSDSVHAGRVCFNRKPPKVRVLHLFHPLKHCLRPVSPPALVSDDDFICSPVRSEPTHTAPSSVAAPFPQLWLRVFGSLVWSAGAGWMSVWMCQPQRLYNERGMSMMLGLCVSVCVWVRAFKAALLECTPIPPLDNTLVTSSEMFHTPGEGLCARCTRTLWLDPVGCEGVDRALVRATSMHALWGTRTRAAL